MPDSTVFITARGYPGVTLFNESIGTWCGYLGIPRTHPLFGYLYHEELIFLEGASIESIVNVHGGVTYTGVGAHYPAAINNHSWIGFDCGHSGDARSPEWLRTQIEKYKEASPSLADLYSRDLDGSNEWAGTYRDEEYVRRNIEQMAEQVYTLGKGIPSSKYFHRLR